jgi:transcriptional regulator with XRE-family HTH domain
MLQAATDTGSVLHVSHIGTLIQAYQDEHGSSDRALALRISVSPTLIGKWKRGTFVELPAPDRIEALADQIGANRGVVLEAFLLDVGYLKESDGDDFQAAPIAEPAPLSDRRRMVSGDDLADLPSVARKRRRPRDGE